MRGWRFIAGVGLLLVAGPVFAQSVLLFAAASLREALDQVAQEFQRARLAKVAVSYGASSALARQIENGAPADLYIAADTDWMDYLAQRKLISPATRTVLLGNRLVLIASADSKVQVAIGTGFPIAGLLGSRRLAVADPASVPAGRYARAALEKLGVWKQVEQRLATGEDVRSALNFVARGEAPLGIVYETDAIAEIRVRVVARFPRGSHPEIVYPAALIARGSNKTAADLLAFLQSGPAQSIFARHGFLRPQ